MSLGDVMENRLKLLRKSRGYTQVSLQMQTGIEQALLSKFENGERQRWPRKRKEQVFYLIPHSFRVEYGRPTLLFLWICAKENRELQPSCTVSFVNIWRNVYLP